MTFASLSSRRRSDKEKERSINALASRVRGTNVLVGSSQSCADLVTNHQTLHLRGALNSQLLLKKTEVPLLLCDVPLLTFLSVGSAPLDLITNDQVLFSLSLSPSLFISLSLLHSLSLSYSHTLCLTLSHRLSLTHTLSLLNPASAGRMSSATSKSSLEH